MKNGERTISTKKETYAMVNILRSVCFMIKVRCWSCKWAIECGKNVGSPLDISYRWYFSVVRQPVLFHTGVGNQQQ